MGPVRQNSIQRTVRSVHICVHWTVHNYCTLLRRTDLIIFPLTLQAIIIAPMMSIWGKGVFVVLVVMFCSSTSQQWVGIE